MANGDLTTNIVNNQSTVQNFNSKFSARELQGIINEIAEYEGDTIDVLQKQMARLEDLRKLRQRQAAQEQKFTDEINKLIKQKSQEQDNDVKVELAARIKQQESLRDMYRKQMDRNAYIMDRLDAANAITRDLLNRTVGEEYTDKLSEAIEHLELKRKSILQLDREISLIERQYKDAKQVGDAETANEKLAQLKELRNSRREHKLDQNKLANTVAILSGDEEAKTDRAETISEFIESKLGEEAGGTLNYLGNAWAGGKDIGRGISNAVADAGERLGTGTKTLASMIEEALGLDGFAEEASSAIDEISNLLGTGAARLGHGAGIAGAGIGALSFLSDLDISGKDIDKDPELAEAITAGLSMAFPELAPFMPFIEDRLGDIVDGVKLLTDIVSKFNQAIGKHIDSAASAIASYYGAINSNLLGYYDNGYKIISDRVDAALGGNTLIKQTDYLSQIATLSASGIARDVETAALLQTIKDRTLVSFDASNASLRRLIRLGQDQVYQTQFGLELQLKKALNSTFKDSGYLQDMFDSVTDAIMDASVQQRGDVTSFNSVVQTWLGAMYSTGLSSNVVSQIANGINYLGSGNVNALAGDEATQRLFLLAMDRVGMDYADILQQGLSLDDTNKLLSSVVQYLAEITDNTSDNLVLKSSYSNLFNLSTTDLQAIKNLSTQSLNIASMAVNSSNALTNTRNAATSMLSANTAPSQKWQNFFDNLQYSIGAEIAESSSQYYMWQSASMLSSAAQSVLNAPLISKLPVVSIPARAAQLLGGTTQFIMGARSIIETIENLGGANGVLDSTSGILTLLGGGGGGGNIFSTTSVGGSTGSSSNVFSRTSLRNSTAMTSMASSVSNVEAEAAKWEDDNNTSKVLGEMEKTIMKLQEGDGYAFAVSLEGMNNNVLRSFASIFADENAMLKTFKGDNKVITDSLFNYLDSSKKSSSTKKST